MKITSKFFLVVATMVMLVSCTGSSSSPVEENSSLPKEYSVIEKMNAQGIADVGYFDDESIFISAYNKGDNAQTGFWELSLAKYSLPTDEINVFYKGTQSTDYMRNIYAYKQANGDEAIFNGATVFFLSNGKLADTVELEEAFRRDAAYDFNSNAIAFVALEERSLYYKAQGSDELKNIYQDITLADEEKRIPYYPSFNPLGDRVLFQTSKGGMISADQLVCYSFKDESIVFDIAIEKKSDTIQYAWFDDNSFCTWEVSDDNGGCTYITVYNANGKITKKFLLNEVVTKIQTGQSHKANALAAIIFDNESDTIKNSVILIDLVNGTVQQVYQSQTVIQSLDLSPNAQKIIWTENEKIYELSLENATMNKAPLSAIIETPSLENFIETLRVYRYFEEGKAYSYSSVDFKDKEQNILSAVEVATEVLPFLKEQLPINSIKIEKSYVAIDFNESFINIFSKSEIEELQNTIAMTILKNAIADSISFSLDGNKDIFGGEVFEVKPYVALEGEVDFKAITSAIPYEGIEYYEFNKVSPQKFKAMLGVEMDETATSISQLLTLIGRIKETALSPNDLNRGTFLYHCILDTKYYSVSKNYVSYTPELIPIADSVSAKLGYEDTFWIADHVEKNAKYLLGDDFQIDFSYVEDYAYKYFEDEGVITPPHMGGGYTVYPIVKSYISIENGYKAQVVYLFESERGISNWGDEKNFTDAEIKEYIENTDNIAEVTVKIEKDGRLVFESCVFK